MAGNINMNNFQQLDPAGAMQRGQQMAMDKMQMQDAGQVRTLRQQAVGAPGGYSMDAHKDLLMNAGFFEEAQDLDDLQNKQVRNKQDALERGLNIMEKTGALVTKVGAPAWPMFRGSLVAAGLADEASLPAEYNEQAAQIAQNFTNNSSDVFRLLKFRSGGQQRDVINIGGKITMGDPYTPGNETAFIKNTKYFAETMGMDEAEAADYMSKSKDKSDAAIYQDLYKKALGTTFGDAEEAAQIAKSGLEAVREVRDSTRQGSGGQPKPAVGPVQRPGALPKPQQFEEGKTYTDAAGNKAKYVAGNWEPVP
jgi:hypothetical protein